MHVCMDVNRVLNEICAQLGMFRCKIYVVYSLGSQTLRTSACVTFIYSAILYVKINVFEQNQTINKCVCMHGMYGCMDVNKVLNEICTQQLGMLRCKIYLVVFLG